MQRYIRVSIVPVPTGLAVPVNDGEGSLRISFSKQCVSKRQADSARANDEVVGFDVVHFCLNSISLNGSLSIFLGFGAIFTGVSSYLISSILRSNL